MPVQKKKVSKKKGKPSGADNEMKVHLLHQMMRIRQMEEKAFELYTQEKIRGFLHLYDGQEAVAVGVIENLKQEDCIVSTYREHGHALVRGISMESIMAEMYGKAEGCSGGRGGSMHLYDKETNFLGGSAIVGNGLPMAVGVAFAYKRQKKNAIACCFFGEGAIDEGEFHESLNLSSLWNLPVLFVCENNLYSMGMPFQLAEAETDLIKKAGSYKIQGKSVDGMDVMAVLNESRKAIQLVKKQQKPFFLECQTYRFRAHSMFDPERYRKKKEVEKWKKKDPVITFSQLLKKEGILSDDDLKIMQKKVADEVMGAVRFAEQGTEESIGDLGRYVYSD